MTLLHTDVEGNRGKKGRGKEKNERRRACENTRGPEGQKRSTKVPIFHVFYANIA